VGRKRQKRGEQSLPLLHLLHLNLLHLHLQFQIQ